MPKAEQLVCPVCGTQIPEDSFECPKCKKDLDTLLSEFREKETRKIISFRKQVADRRKLLKEPPGRMGLALSPAYIELIQKYRAQFHKTERPFVKQIIEEALFEYFKQRSMNPPQPKRRKINR